MGPRGGFSDLPSIPILQFLLLLPKNPAI
jgi:hypothetical protein